MKEESIITIHRYQTHPLLCIKCVFIIKYIYKAGLQFCQVFLDVDTEECQRRNAGRCSERRVPGSVISRMSQQMDTPNPNRFFWEIHTITIQFQDLDTIQYLFIFFFFFFFFLWLLFQFSYTIFKNS